MKEHMCICSSTIQIKTNQELTDQNPVIGLIANLMTKIQEGHSQRFPVAITNDSVAMNRSMLLMLHEGHKLQNREEGGRGGRREGMKLTMRFLKQMPCTADTAVVGEPSTAVQETTRGEPLSCQGWAATGVRHAATRFRSTVLVGTCWSHEKTIYKQWCTHWDISDKNLEGYYYCYICFIIQHFEVDLTQLQNMYIFFIKAIISDYVQYRIIYIADSEVKFLDTKCVT